MIDTVPKGVNLTEIIEPLPVKPQGIQVVVLNDGTFALRGEVRVSISFMRTLLVLNSFCFLQFWDMQEDGERVVKMFWADRSGKKSDAYQATIGHTIDQVSNSTTGEFHTALWYSFNRTENEHAVVDPILGVSRVWFTTTDKNGTQTYDQGGIGFAVQDTLLMGNTSCSSFDSGSNGASFEIKIAVSDILLKWRRRFRTYFLFDQIRGNAIPDRVFFEYDIIEQNTNPSLFTDDLKMSSGSSVGNGAYTLYSTHAIIPFRASSGNIAAVIDGKTYRTPWVENILLGSGVGCLSSSAARLQWSGPSLFLGFVFFWVWA
jgi:hypothetical protein